MSVVASFLATVAFSRVTSASPDLKRCVNIGDDYYVAGPPQRLTNNFISEVRFTGSGKFLFLRERESNLSYPRARVIAAERRPPYDPELAVRVNVESGVRETIYREKPNETLLDIEPVGPNGDSLLKVAVGIAPPDPANPADSIPIWNVLFCPVGQPARLVRESVPARSLNLSASEDIRAAAILTCGPGRAARLTAVTPSGIDTQSLDVIAAQGFFLPGRTESGAAVLLLQAERTYQPILFAEVDFRTGKIQTRRELPKLSPRESIVNPLFEVDLVQRASGAPEESRSPLFDLVLTPARGQKGRGSILLTQGSISTLAASPTGRAFVFSNSEGVFLRELLIARGPRREEVRKDFEN